ncbi:MAG TPA: HAD family phosphatase [Candidatus Binataceae bacterium]|nr:HAD family phosphatase [Candidatus Binataceae bacterium]
MIRTILFDLDGTLADTEPLHYVAFAETLRPEGIELSREEYFSRLIGFNDHDCFETVLTENGKDASAERIEALIERKAARYQEMIHNRDVMYPGAADFVRECAARFPLMIVTGTLREEAEMILRRAGLRELFLDIVAAEDVEHGKPEPDGFVVALGRLGFLLRQRDAIEPAQALVIEDTAAGIEAGRRAGMRVLALRQTAPEADLAAADLIRASFADTDLDDIVRRLA